jgi:hypothetical protein
MKLYIQLKGTLPERTDANECARFYSPINSR